MSQKSDKIKPLDITSEKELIQEFQGFQDLLQNVTNDWNDRLKALKRIQGYIMGQNRYNETFLNQYLKLTPQINIQLKDLRSAISKEACQLICLSSEKLESSFEQIAVKYMHKDSLLQTISSGNKVIADNGNQCISSLIDNVQSEKFITAILDEFNTKNKNTRERISGYIIQILSIYNVAHIDKYSKQIEQAIIKGNSDPSQDVRANIREAFCIYKEYFKEKGEKMQQNFDPQTRRALQDQLENYKHVYENIVNNNKSLEQFQQRKQKGNLKKSNINNNPSSVVNSQKIGIQQQKEEFVPNPLKQSQNLKLFDNQQQQQQQDNINQRNTINRSSNNSTSTQQSVNLSKSTLNNSNGFKQGQLQQQTDLLFNSQIQNVPGRHSQLPTRNSQPASQQNRQSKSVKRGENNNNPEQRYTLKNKEKDVDNNNIIQNNRFKSPQKDSLNINPNLSKKTSNSTAVSDKSQQQDNQRKSSLFNLNGAAVSTKNKQLKEKQQSRNNSSQNQNYQINLEEELQKQFQKKTNLVPSNIQQSGQHQYVKYVQQQENNQKIGSDQNLEQRKQMNQQMIHGSPSIQQANNRIKTENYENQNQQQFNIKPSKFNNQQQYNQPQNNYLVPKDDIEENQDAFQQYESIEGWNDEEILYYIEKTNNDVWATRSSAFESISQILDNYCSIQEEQIIKIQEISNDVLKQLIQTHVQHLSDSHFKVQQACQTSTFLLIQSNESIIFPYIQQILPKVIVNLTINKISKQSHEIINLLKESYSCDDLVNPILKFLEQSHKQPVKICALEILMDIIQNTENYYSHQNNVRSTVNQISFIIKQHYNIQQIIQPSLGIFMILKEINPQITYHSILSLIDQDLVASIRLLACKYQPQLEEGLKGFLINPNQVNMQQQQLQQQQIQNQRVKPKINQQKIQQQIPIKHNNFMGQQQNNNTKNEVQQNNFIMKQQQQQLQQQQQFQDAEEIGDIDELQIVIRNFEQNQELISSSINDIIKSLTESFNNYSNKSQTKVLQVLSDIFSQNYTYARMVPDSVTDCLNLYTNIPKHIDIFEIDEIVENMLNSVPPIITLKALIDKISYEKSPFLQILIKKISLVITQSKKQEVSPFLDHLIDLYKEHINEQCPDVRKSVVFCLVDLHFLFGSDLDPYLQMFTINQQKLVAIYIKRKIEGGQNNNNNHQQQQQQQQKYQHQNGINNNYMYDIQSQ